MTYYVTFIIPKEADTKIIVVYKFWRTLFLK